MLSARNGQKFQSTAPYRHKARESQHDIMKGIGIVGNVVNGFYFRISVCVFLCLSKKLCKIYFLLKFAPQFKFKLNKILIIKTFEFNPVTRVSKMIFKVNVAVLISFAIN